MKKELTLTGRIVSGVKQGAFFTRLEWFRAQCRDKLGFEPYAGTLNLEIPSEDIPIVEALEQEAGIEFVPPDSAFCSGRGLPVMVEGIRAAVVFPAEEVRVHGRNIVEIICDKRLKHALNVDDGDSVILSIGAKGTLK